MWVDAVCIDQSNIVERNHQVKSMASVFSEASKVLVWLGPKECGSAFSTVACIASCREALNSARDVPEVSEANSSEENGNLNKLVENDAYWTD